MFVQTFVNVTNLISKFVHRRYAKRYLKKKIHAYPFILFFIKGIDVKYDLNDVKQI